MRVSLNCSRLHASSKRAASRERARRASRVFENCPAKSGCAAIPNNRRPASIFWLTLLATCFVQAWAAAQTSAPAVAPPNAQFVLGAHEDALWLARVVDGQSNLTHRLRGAEFALPVEIARAVAVLCPVDESAFAVFRDGGLYRFSQATAEETAERDLPKHRVPLSVIADGTTLLALVPPEPGAGEGEPPSLPLRVVRYNGREWSPLADCDLAAGSGLSGRTRARILVADDQLVLAWAEGEKIFTAARPLGGGNWTRASPIDAAGLAGFWLLAVNSSPTLVAAVKRDESAEQLVGWRLGATGALEWKAIQWRMAEGGASSIGKVEDAAGFNQQLALIVRDSSNALVLTFAREGQPPTEPAASVHSVFDVPARANELQDWARIITFSLLVLLLIGLFAFRRESMTEAAALPADVALAYSSQRLLAGLLDLAPFALSAAYFCNVDIVDGFKSLLNWGLFNGPGVALPSQAVVMWWVLTVGGFTIYCLILEAALGRTIGKLIAGTRVCAKGGGRAGLAAVLVRSGFRLLEMIPQFWIFAFLVVLSRNRQRLGDIFANTYVVRKVADKASKPVESD